jgi:hypothetical protein
MALGNATDLVELGVVKEDLEALCHIHEYKHLITMSQDPVYGMQRGRRHATDTPCPDHHLSHATGGESPR